MKYVSTRSKPAPISSAEAIIAGLAPDGGLFLPETIPVFDTNRIQALSSLDYPGRAAKVLAEFLTDYTHEELLTFCKSAYSGFTSEAVAPVVPVFGNAYMLELFHGPTCAFKDFALQLLPFLLTAAVKKTGTQKTVVILVATSGDTGKAALEGFADVPGTRICVFYPNGGVSGIQRRQMTTQDGANVMVLSAKGNFDDAQNGVKRIFTDSELAATLLDAGFMLSSANSINWGRLAPQIAYYISAYCDLYKAGNISFGEKINIVVPTGNFGNILAAYFAKCCGLPVNKLICASNRNSVLTDFINTGTYDRNREFFTTTSPSMDILVSSNLERLLYLLCDRDDVRTGGLMKALNESGKYTIDAAMLSRLQAEFAAGYANDRETAYTIKQLFERTGYLCDTHTAVAVKVYEDYLKATGDNTKTVIASTASPFKFANSVLNALGHVPAGDDFELLKQLSAISGLAIPKKLAELETKTERFNTAIEPKRMKAAVLDWLIKGDL